MRARDWALVLVGFPALGVPLLVAVAWISTLYGFSAPSGLSNAWLSFMALSPVTSLVLLRVRRADSAHALAALLVNVVVTVVFTYPALILIWANVLCEPGMHDMCLR